MKFLHFNAVPPSADLGLLVLRAWFGLSMLILHGWGKVTGFGSMAEKFADPLNLGQTPTLVLAIFCEVVCSVLIVLGLFTRAAAIVGIVTMGVAFWIVHGHKLSGPGSGEMAFLYLAAYVVLFIAGPGRYSVDAKIGARV